MPKHRPTTEPESQPIAAPEPSRSGTVALIGRPNVGKSTLLNAALEQPLAIVSPTPETTRDTLLGVVRVGASELLLLDTPGLHKARYELNRAMNRSARQAARDADVVVFVTDVSTKAASSNPDRPAVMRVDPRDKALLSDVTRDRPTILALNKIDRSRDKREILPYLEEMSRIATFQAIVPVSAKRSNGVRLLLEEIAKLLPEGPHRYDVDTLTDRPTRFFAAEYVREQVLLATKEEVPHATAVTIDAFEEQKGRYRIAATLHVERTGQKKILIGAGGEVLKRIGTFARKRIEELAGTSVRLELFVRVTPGWRDSTAMLREISEPSAAPERES